MCASYLELISIYPEDFLILGLGSTGLASASGCRAGVLPHRMKTTHFCFCKWHASPHSLTLPPTWVTKFLGHIRRGIFTDLPRLGQGWVSDYKIWQEEAKSLQLFLMKSQLILLFSSLPKSLSWFMSLSMLSEINHFASSWPSSLPMHDTKAGAQLYVSHRCGVPLLSPWHPWKPSRYCSSHRTVMTMKTQTRQNMDTCQFSGYNRIKTTLMNLPASGPLPLTWH